MYWLQPASIPKGIVKAGKACLLAMAPIEWIASWPPIDPATQMLTGDITLAAGRQWLRAILVSNGTPLKCDDQSRPAGLFRQVSITGRTVGHSIPIHHYLTNYPHHRWVLLYKEAGTDITYVIGSNHAGATLATSYDNAANTINTLTFSISQLHRPLVYRGSFTLDNNVTIDTGATLGVAFYTGTGTEGNTFTPATNLRGRTILWVSRSGMKDLAPVSGAPTNDVEIQFDSPTNTFTLHPDWPVAAAETFFILYR